MSKITDYNSIYAVAEIEIDKYEWTLLDYVTREQAKIIVANIYITQDFTKGFGQDVKPNLSVISSPNKISIILDDTMSFYKCREPMVEYTNLSIDIYSILSTIQAVFERIQYLQ